MPHTTRPTAAAPAAGRSAPAASPLSVQPGQKLYLAPADRVRGAVAE